MCFWIRTTSQRRRKKRTKKKKKKSLCAVYCRYFSIKHKIHTHTFQSPSNQKKKLTEVLHKNEALAKKEKEKKSEQQKLKRDNRQTKRTKTRENSTSYKLSRSVPSHVSSALDTHKVLSAFTLPSLSIVLLLVLANMLVNCVCGRDVIK